MRLEDEQYDVALSFAGEQRDYVSQVADSLAQAGLRVFYDEYEDIELWGKDLYSHLDRIYRKLSRYCVLFISKDYAVKVWTNHERESAQARALEEHREYVLPVRFDSTELPGLRPTIGYLNVEGKSPDELASKVVAKIGGASPSPKLSDSLDSYLRVVEKHLLENDWFVEDWLAATDPDDLPTDGPAFTPASEYDHWTAQARGVFRAFSDMSEVERTVVGLTLAYGCPGELPKLVHIDPVDLCRRTGMDEPTILKAMSDVRWLGFEARRRETPHVDDELIVSSDAWDLTLRWWNSALPWSWDSTLAARALVQVAMESCCSHHAAENLRAADFSMLG